MYQSLFRHAYRSLLSYIRIYLQVQKLYGESFSLLSYLLVSFVMYSGLFRHAYRSLLSHIRIYLQAQKLYGESFRPSELLDLRNAYKKVAAKRSTTWVNVIVTYIYTYSMRTSSYLYTYMHIYTPLFHWVYLCVTYMLLFFIEYMFVSHIYKPILYTHPHTIHMYI